MSKMKAMWPIVRAVLVDLVGVIGCGALIEGVAMIYRPAAFILAGGLMIAGSWLLSRKAG